ncbi:hypothetical protein BDR04DRAFT_1198442 [Suillus decipiens]|nr:hypothetical protein BDR04DRAFT_1198442 [Suillus decipiens]
MYTPHTNGSTRAYQNSSSPNPQVLVEQVLREILVHLENLERCVHERMLEARKHVVERLANCQPNVMMMILVYLDELERCIDERISETRRDVIEHLANCTPNVTMGGNEQHMRYVAHCETLLDPLLDPAFRGSRPETPKDQIVGDVPTITNDGHIIQPAQGFSGAGFQQAPSNFPAKARVRCSGCDAVFNKDNWRRHLNEVHGAKPKTSCNRCGKSFKRKSSMKGHKCRGR